MGIRMKVAALAVVTVLSAALVTVSAQTSNTKTATAGQYSNDIDNYLSVTGFGNVALKSWYGYAGYDNSYFTAGYATKLGPIYLGLYYNGYALANNDNPTETETVATTAIVNGYNEIVGTSKTTSTQWTSNPTDYTQNTGKVLIGVGGMGFKLGFDQSATVREDRFEPITAPNVATVGTWTGLFSSGASSQTDSKTVVSDADGNDVSATVTKYKGGRSDNSYMTPSLQWGGLALNLGSMVLKPDVTVTTNFVTDAFAAEKITYSQAFGEDNPSYAGVSDLSGTYTDASSGYNRGYLGLGGKLNLSLDLAPKGDAKKNISFAYQYDTNLYSNAYQDQNGKDKAAAGNAAWYEKITYSYDPTIAEETVTKLRAYEVAEKAYSKHLITPSYKFSNKLGDKISFAVKAELPTTLQFDTTTTSGKLKQTERVESADGDVSNDYVETTTKTYKGNTVEQFQLTLAPVVSSGLQYALTPSLTLNSGLKVSVPGFYSSTTETTKSGFNTLTVQQVYGDGTIGTDSYEAALTSTRTESQANAGDWDQLTASVSAGFSWKMGEGITLDTLMSTTGFTVTASTFSVQLSVLR